MNFKNFLLAIILVLAIPSFAQDSYTPLLKVNAYDVSLSESIEQVKDLLNKAGFDVIGEYHPENNQQLYVIAYTRDDIKSIVKNFADRGMMAATLKIGFVVKEGKTVVSLLNPMYMFYAYLLEGIEKYEGELIKIDADLKSTFSSLGSLEGFGGELSKKELKKYRYKIMMPYFTSPVELMEFSSFEQGLEIIRKNLENKKGNCVKVYEVVDIETQTAVFGVGLLDNEKGEVNFLPVISEDHIAAMPYDIILQKNTATMLHGRFRFALYWPELTMGTFMKIMSTPGNVEDFMEDLTH